MDFVDFHAQQNRIKDQLGANILRVLARSKLNLRPEATELEEQFVTRVSARQIDFDACTCNRFKSP